MKPTRIAAVLLVLVAVLVASACGGSDKETVPPDAVAVVDGTSVTKAELDSLLSRAKKTYTAQKRAFPKAGTAEYQALQTQAVAFLVQRAEYDHRAADMKLDVTDKEITDRISQIKQQSFEGSQKKLDDALKAQGYTTASLRADIKAQLVSEKIYNEVTKDAKVSDAEIEKYYNENKTQFTKKESRDVRHILVKTKAQADELYTQLKGGASFAALAKRYSQDPGSKDNGGKLTIEKGQTVPAFDQTAFSLPTNSLSRPVKSEYGYHLIQPVSAVRPSSTKTLKDAKAEIQATLLEKAKNDAITKWTTDTKDFFAEKVSYATGFAPPAAATEASTTTG
jgi:parvulin-like peptidyl-prolyl isomerase